MPARFSLRIRGVLISSSVYVLLELINAFWEGCTFVNPSQNKESYHYPSLQMKSLECLVVLLLLATVILSRKSEILTEEEIQHGHAHVKAPTGKISKHEFQPMDQVDFFVNKIGPYSNPSETYEYYKLPFCKPDKVLYKHATFGEALDGDTFATSLYDLRFRVEIMFQKLCAVSYDKNDLQLLRDAIDQQYYFEFMYDDLPMWGYVGEKVEGSSNGMSVGIQDAVEGVADFYLATHLHFDIGYNGPHIVEVNVTSDFSRFQRISNQEEMQFEYSYSARWIESDIPFKSRMERYKTFSFFPTVSPNLEIHWLSILNSSVLVIFLLVSFSVLLVRILARDYRRYTLSLDEGSEDETGWKLLHGDVFRWPPLRILLCASLGVGHQLLVMAGCILLLAGVGAFYPESHGNLRTAMIVLYALTSGVAGYMSNFYYRKMDGDKWAWVTVLTTVLLALPTAGLFFATSALATIYTATNALPFSTVVAILLLWVLIGWPSIMVSSLAAKHFTSVLEPPCRTKRTPREIPAHIPWHRTWYAQALMSGFISFAAMFVELYYIFASLWGYAPYNLYGVLTVVFCILLVVDVTITVALVYFQLAAEDHRWWWSSFLYGGSVSLFVMLYSAYFFVFKSEMSGLLQATVFFGNMLLISFALFLMMGTVGFVASWVFVKRIYATIKVN